MDGRLGERKRRNEEAGKTNRRKARRLRLEEGKSKMGIRNHNETSAGFTPMKFQVCIQKVRISANPKTGDMSARPALVPD